MRENLRLLFNRTLRWLPRALHEALYVEPRYECPECEDTGMASYEDWIGSRGYRVYDHCRACRKRQRATSVTTPPAETGG